MNKIYNSIVNDLFLQSIHSNIYIYFSDWNEMFILHEEEIVPSSVQTMTIEWAYSMQLEVNKILFRLKWWKFEISTTLWIWRNTSRAETLMVSNNNNNNKVNWTLKSSACTITYDQNNSISNINGACWAQFLIHIRLTRCRATRLISHHRLTLFLFFSFQSAATETGGWLQCKTSIRWLCESLR